eukprot:2517414-Prymnesium_polylepis.2
MEPLWCDDPSPFGYHGSISNAEDWMRKFYHQDGPPFVHEQGVRQCKWKRSQKDKFIDTMRAHYIQRKWEGLNEWYFGTLWNEVNLYVGPGDGGVEQIMWDSLIGLVFVRNTGNADDLGNMRELAAHIKTLGRDVPMFAINAGMDCLKWWDQDVTMDLLAAPYNLEQIF